MADEEQPKTEGQINLHIKNQQGESVYFKVKSKTKLAKVFAQYHSRMGATDGTYAFTFDGTRLNDDETVGDHDLEDDDLILAVLGQTGGC